MEHGIASGSLRGGKGTSRTVRKEQPVKSKGELLARKESSGEESLEREIAQLDQQGKVAFREAFECEEQQSATHYHEQSEAHNEKARQAVTPDALVARWVVS